MPPKRKGGKGKRTAAPGASHASLDVLPDEVLHHVLSFLPAQEAVRTCVLARRWRHLWRSATGLRILYDGRGEGEGSSVKKLREFVDHLFLLRGTSPLDTCQLRLLHLDYDSSRFATHWTHLWICHVLMCGVRKLSLNISLYSYSSRCYVKHLPLISQHLMRLELSSLFLTGAFVDFSSYPALEVLEIKECGIVALGRISSLSLKSLRISDNCAFSESHRVHVYAPNLVSLWLEVLYGRAPIIEKMPSLVEAMVQIDSSEDGDFCYDSRDCGDEDCPCSGGVYGDTDCVLLQGLSEVHSLVLTSETTMFILRRDLKCCPIFSNLKTLLLNEYWCVPADFSALTCILEHSPVLEMLTLQLFCKGPKSKLQIKGSPDPTERSNAIPENLKVVEVKCEMVDDRVLNVLEFLKNLGIYSYRFQI